ncbi:MAG: DUF4178 domain-containing protein [Chloroflexota bacterium]
MNSGRALGVGLIVLGAVLGALVLVWLVVNAGTGDLQAGGFVFGLIILAVLALPPVGAGLVLMRRAAAEQVEQERFERRRQVLEADQMFRTTIARDLRQLERRLVEMPGRSAAVVRASSRVRDLVDDVEQVGYDQATWHDAVQLEDGDLDSLRRYDDLLQQGLRRTEAQVDALSDGAEGAETALITALQQWDETLAQRQDLLLRGKRAVTAAPGELLQARPSRGAGDVTRLKIADAVSVSGDDYLVELSVTYFGGGKTWWLHRVRSGPNERWLHVSPEGLSVTLATTIESPGDPRSEMIRYKGSACRPTEEGDATATISGPEAQQEGIAVHYWRFAAPDGSALTVEHWPDEQRAYVGKPVKPGSLEIFHA